MAFKGDFIWGVASSSYQTEGAAFEDDKGASIWDLFCRKPGTIDYGHTGEIACDFYHRYEEDIRLMAELGIKNYRFSLSWPRIFPNGKGTLLNQRGLDYYDRVVDLCLSLGITPWITLYHWDLPAALEGGWEDCSTAYAFADYVEFITQHFKGRVRHYFTLNEPQCIVDLGYGRGIHAPGKKLPTKERFKCWYHVLLANGLAIRKMRNADPGIKVGIVSTGDMCYPQTYEDMDAAKLLSFPDGDGWGFTHHWLLDPICLGSFPHTENKELSDAVLSITQKDKEIIRVPMDFIGLNLYNGHAAALIDGKPSYVPKHAGFPRTALKWPVVPEVMRYGPRWIYERYGLPLIITENGQSCNDRIYLDGHVHDPDRIDYLQRYLSELSKACSDGVPVLGYFHWSFTDNFEWTSGYEERFGLVYVNYPSQKRIPKDSAYWYSKTILENGKNITENNGTLSASTQLA